MHCKRQQSWLLAQQDSLLYPWEIAQRECTAHRGLVPQVETAA